VDVYKFPDGHREFIGDMDCDVDGAPFWKQDPTGQAETTLRLHGKSIDSSIVCGIVLPPECIAEPAGIVMGCKAEAEWRGRLFRASCSMVVPTGKQVKVVMPH
jgi:hypothetical protein